MCLRWLTAKCLFAAAEYQQAPQTAHGGQCPSGRFRRGCDVAQLHTVDYHVTVVFTVAIKSNAFSQSVGGERANGILPQTADVAEVIDL